MSLGEGGGRRNKENQYRDEGSKVDLGHRITIEKKDNRKERKGYAKSAKNCNPDFFGSSRSSEPVELPPSALGRRDGRDARLSTSAGRGGQEHVSPRSAYLPAGVNDVTHAGQRATLRFGMVAAGNLFREFAPQMPRPVRTVLMLIAR